jgi:hypothetical protein
VRSAKATFWDITGFSVTTSVSVANEAWVLAIKPGAGLIVVKRSKLRSAGENAAILGYRLERRVMTIVGISLV